MQGYDHVVERGVQGVDLDVARSGGPRYAIEVKTTIEPKVTFGEKDFESLSQRGADGYLPVIAVLRLSPLGDWVVLDASKIGPGNYFIDQLVAYRVKELEAEAKSAFENAVHLHGPRLMSDGPKHLDDLIRGRTSRVEGGLSLITTRGPS